MAHLSPARQSNVNDDSICDFEAAINAKTRSSWNSYRQHRQEITRIILSASQKHGQNVLILGAGNCNDLDLNRLVSKGTDLHLADVDIESSLEGVKRQGLTSDAIASVKKIEMSGLSTIDSSTLASESSFAAALDLDQICTHYVEHFDVVICTCVFSQMAGALRRATQPDWDQSDLLVTLRRRFINEMNRLTAAGGLVIWISDLVSTDTCPEIHTTPTEALPSLLKVCLNSGNFLSGTHPQRVFEDLAKATGSTALMHRPWIWSMGARKYAVYAISAVSVDQQSSNS